MNTKVLKKYFVFEKISVKLLEKKLNLEVFFILTLHPAGFPFRIFNKRLGRFEATNTPFWFVINSNANKLVAKGFKSVVLQLKLKIIFFNFGSFFKFV